MDIRSQKQSSETIVSQLRENVKKMQAPLTIHESEADKLRKGVS